MSQQTTDIPSRIELLRRNCLVLYRTWWTTHYAIGIIGVLAGGIAGAAATNDRLKQWGWLYGAVAAFSTSLVTFLGPLQRAQRYWEAFHSIDDTCFDYEQHLIDDETLSRKSKEARAMLLGRTAVPNRDGNTTASL